MSRFPSDFLPFYESNQSGQQAPVTRLSLSIPKGLNLTGDEIRQVEDEIFNRYRNAARGALTVFRQMRNSSTIELASQRRKLDEFVMAEYYSHQGLEYYTLTVGEELVKKIVEEGANPLCLLIQHTGGVKAVLMSNVYKGDFTVEYASSKGGGSGKTHNTQQQMSDDWSYSTVLGLLTKTEVGIGGFNGGGDLINGHADGSGVTLYTTTQTIYIDVANKTSRVVAEVPAADVTAISESGDRKETDNQSNYDPVTTYGTNASTFYFEQSKTGSGSRHAEAPSIITKVASGRKYRDQTWTTNYFMGFTITSLGGCLGESVSGPNYTSEENHSDATQGYFDGELIYYTYKKTVGENTQAATWLGVTTSTFGPFDLDVIVFLPGGTYSYVAGFATSSGGVSKNYFTVVSDSQPAGSTVNYPVGHMTTIMDPTVVNSSNAVTTSFDYLWPDGAAYWYEQASGAFCGAHHISDVTTFTGPYGTSGYRKLETVTSPNKSVSPYFFPYAVNGQIYKRVTDSSGDTALHTIHTPYGVLVEGTESPAFNGWLNLSDGGVLIQGCTVYVNNQWTYGLYVNGSRFSEVSGVSVENIDTMVLNVPLKWIKQQWPKP